MSFKSCISRAIIFAKPERITTASWQMLMPSQLAKLLARKWRFQTYRDVGADTGMIGVCLVNTDLQTPGFWATKAG